MLEIKNLFNELAARLVQMTHLTGAMFLYTCVYAIVAYRFDVSQPFTIHSHFSLITRVFLRSVVATDPVSFLFQCGGGVYIQ